MNSFSSLAYAQNVIGNVSRTFAIGINMLRGDLKKAVLTAYLLARIVDTIEDDNSTATPDRVALIEQFIHCLQNPTQIPLFVQQSVKIQGEREHIELLQNSEKIFDLLNGLPKQSQQILQHWISILANGMKAFIERYPQGIRIQTLEEYHQYCYFVAGTVGHLLTELFYYHSPWINEKSYQQLLKRSEAFGEALQTINILKDIATDAVLENEIFIPEELLHIHKTSQAHLMQAEWRSQNQAALQSIIDLAEKNLEQAQEYFYSLPKMAVSIRLFCWLPLIFGVATLRDIKCSDAMLKPGGVIKISRSEVRFLLRTSLPAVLCNKFSRYLIKKTKSYLRTQADH